jgi:hypothetical protein
MNLYNTSSLDGDSLWKLAKETESLHKLKSHLEQLPSSERGDSLLEVVNNLLTTPYGGIVTIKNQQDEIISLKQRIKSLEVALEFERQKCQSLIVSWDHPTLDVYDILEDIPERAET